MEDVVVPAINAKLQVTRDFQVIYEGDSDFPYPHIFLDYYTTNGWDGMRMQFYDALHIHVKVSDNDQWLAGIALECLDSILGFDQSKRVVNHVKTVCLKDIVAFIEDEGLSLTVPPVIGTMEIRLDQAGWTETGTETLRHHWRDAQIFY